MMDVKNKNEVKRGHSAFGKANFVGLAVGMALVVMGFVLMTGPSSDAGHFEKEIFSARRIKVAPVVCLAGYVVMAGAVIWRSRKEEERR